ncbi:ArsR/SmtB family transcription factor [Desulfobulbus alkaliphilus]|uniref:ArsR/SmtB family transcription factor n=1 Tax=Desulfobulbus alkaliphilus TaxID=869814 RepID=UPI0019663EAE|nr:metalloregulator ArsR/SmtB family transcription factor [Desulfobulbus alkaliphilus]MBM9537917.1 winged helix-turn-helix transcriptional regulator [Desulfobulbus alkaliphilus]
MKITAEFFKSLADETRLRLLVLLHEGREYCVCDLVQALGIPQSTLAYLRRHGWLQGRREGLWMHYSLVSGFDSLYRDQLNLVVSRLAGTKICREDRQRLTAWCAENNNAICR